MHYFAVEPIPKLVGSKLSLFFLGIEMKLSDKNGLLEVLNNNLHPLFQKQLMRKLTWTNIERLHNKISEYHIRAKVLLQRYQLNHSKNNGNRAIIFLNKNLCMYICLKWTYGLFGKDCRIAFLSKFKKKIKIVWLGMIIELLCSLKGTFLHKAKSYA